MATTKAEARRRLAEEGVSSARSRQVADEDEAVAYADLIGTQVDLEPQGMVGSAGVLRTDTVAAVREAYLRASFETVLGLDAYDVPGVLVEEYLAGPAISAESVVLSGGDVRTVAITRKPLGLEPRFLHQAVTRVVQSLGIEQGSLL